MEEGLSSRSMYRVPCRVGVVVAVELSALAAAKSTATMENGTAKRGVIVVVVLVFVAGVDRRFQGDKKWAPLALLMMSKAKRLPHPRGEDE